MKIVFFGTPEYVLPIVESLHKNFKSKKGESPIVAVVTQKPKPVGRKKILTHSPVDKWAHGRKVSVFYDPEGLIKKNVKADVGILVAYQNRISNKLLNHFPNGILNIHLSLLPKYRSSSCIQAAIISEGKQTGATIFKLDSKLDHGPIVSQVKEDILPTDTAGSLRERLFKISAKSIAALLPDYISGKIKPREQDHSKATYANMIKKSDAFIPPDILDATLQGSTFKGRWKIPFVKNYSLVPDSHSLERFIRAMQPWPVAWSTVKLDKSRHGPSKRLKILKAHLSQPTTHNPQLKLDMVQLEGKSPVSWKQLKEGYPNLNFVSHPNNKAQ